MRATVTCRINLIWWASPCVCASKLARSGRVIGTASGSTTRSGSCCTPGIAGARRRGCTARGYDSEVHHAQRDSAQGGAGGAPRSAKTAASGGGIHVDEDDAGQGGAEAEEDETDDHDEDKPTG